MNEPRRFRAAGAAGVRHVDAGQLPGVANETNKSRGSLRGPLASYGARRKMRRGQPGSPPQTKAEGAPAHLPSQEPSLRSGLRGVK